MREAFDLGLMMTARFGDGCPSAKPKPCFFLAHGSESSETTAHSPARVALFSLTDLLPEVLQISAKLPSNTANVDADSTGRQAAADASMAKQRNRVFVARMVFSCGVFPLMLQRERQP